MAFLSNFGAKFGAIFEEILVFSSGFRSKIGNFEQFFRQKLEISSDFRENICNLEQYSVISSGLKDIAVPQSNYWRGHVSPPLIVHFLHTFSKKGPLVGPKVVEWGGGHMGDWGRPPVST